MVSGIGNSRTSYIRRKYKHVNSVISSCKQITHNSEDNKDFRLDSMHTYIYTSMYKRTKVLSINSADQRKPISQNETKNYLDFRLSESTWICGLAGNDIG